MIENSRVSLTVSGCRIESKRERGDGGRECLSKKERQKKSKCNCIREIVSVFL
jgi:hypothetical protein